LDDGYLVFSAVPTGVFVDTAMSLVTCFVPEPSLEERRAALIAASKLASARGLTSVVDFGRFSPGETAQQAWDDLNGIKFPTLFVMLSCPCMSSKVHVEEHGIK
jgi:predicted amidohydrolase YtcJ